ncbi:thioredoxin domain-containing protein, partial [Acinetobacter baumannii]
HDLLFSAQRTISPSTFDAKLKSFLADAKLKEKPFLACYDGKKTQARIDKDVAESEALGLTSTPSFLVNGHLISGGADYASIKGTIEEAL